MQLLLNDDAFKIWEPLPYFWFAFHWLAMSHSCYNPIIYCYMNARFRGGFLQIIYRVPGLRRCCCLRRYLHNRGERNYDATGEMTFKFNAGNGGGLLRKPKIRIRCHHILVFSVFYCLSLTFLAALLIFFLKIVYRALWFIFARNLCKSNTIFYFKYHWMFCVFRITVFNFALEIYFFFVSSDVTIRHVQKFIADYVRGKSFKITFNYNYF